jgi:hypothetical protein
MVFAFDITSDVDETVLGVSLPLITGEGLVVPEQL